MHQTEFTCLFQTNQKVNLTRSTILLAQDWQVGMYNLVDDDIKTLEFCQFQMPNLNAH